MKNLTVRSSATAALFVLCFAVQGKAVWGQPHARLSPGVQKHAASGSIAPLDVIVSGTAAQIDSIAARHGLTIKKRLDEGAVFRASGAQLNALSADPVIAYVARDVAVTSFMAVTDPAIGADQV